MLFNTLQYALFLPVVVLVYCLAPRNLRLWILLIASYLFYASWNALYLLLIIGMTAGNYFFGVGLARLEGKKGRRELLILAVVLNLAVLTFYKYTLFLLQSLVGILSFASIKISPPSFSIILPLGISFFTFEFIHYVVDVYKGKPVVKSPLEFAVFAAFFPTQIAGPIKRYEDFVPQMEKLARPSWGQIGQGLQLLLFGLFKKVALADNLSVLVEKGFVAIAADKPSPSFLDCWLIALAFALQIYFDFTGYTDMGRGSALLLGYQVPENFNRPYVSTNISDFWRRWHISLSSWLRDYLYIAMGGNRRHRSRNLFLTMVIGGLWHGANWTFVIWGAWHGFLLVVYWHLKKLIKVELSGLPKLLLAIGGWAFTMLLVAIGWIFFRAPNLSDALEMLAMMVQPLNPNVQRITMNSDRLFIGLVALGCISVELFVEHRSKIQSWFENSSLKLFVQAANLAWTVQPVGYVLLIVLTLLLKPKTGQQFIYFQF